MRVANLIIGQGGVFASIFLAVQGLCIPATSAQNTEQYEYDALGRLRAVVRSDLTRQFFTYDAAGNRESVTTNVIEGTSGDDALSGDAEVNALFGLAGDDVLNGRAHADLLNGGDGVDLATYANASSGVYVFWSDLGNATGEAAGDIFVGVEGLIGSAYADILGTNDNANPIYGLAGADQLYGLGANDLVEGGAGGDFLNGGAGDDVASYAFASAGVYVFFSDLGNATGDATGDSFSSIEGLRGSNFADILGVGGGANTLFGASGADQLYGLDGNDTIEGGPGGDFMNGGADFDVASYSTAASGVYVFFGDLGNATGEAAGDSLANIEGLIGSAFNDVLGMDATANTLDGGPGNDILYGQAGDDTLTGGGGADRYAATGAGFGNDVITSFEDGADKVDFTAFAGLNFPSLSLSQVSDGVLVSVGSDSMLLSGVVLAQIDASDFEF